jgi:hypothetical protein
MQEKIINLEEAVQTIKRWQEAGRDVEVRLRFSQGITQTHSGYVSVEQDGRVVVADVDRDRYYTTVIDPSPFTAIKLIESESAIIFAEPQENWHTFESVILACRQHGDESSYRFSE